ncbi:response regulator [Paenibacillus pasadenensis]|uniref:response regulator n=1 Tax=Paenibacillus pasadenensis TaxID=217090 RepID=UPI0004032C58|nr:response regulator [Paenibacillus pasadenensis]
MLRAIIVDDEELSMRRLARIAGELGGVEIAATFFHPSEACAYVRDHHVDVAFLDINMPEIDGMELGLRLRQLREPLQIVFVSGYDRYAVDAFEQDAVDYVLKPVNAERLAKTLERLSRRARPPQPPPSAPKLGVRMFGGLRFFRTDGPGRETPIKLRSPKTEELFAYLLCKGTASREEVADTLWRGLEPDKAAKNINSTLYYIRKSLAEAGLEPLLLAGRYDIRIDAARVDCDLYEYERLVQRIRAEAAPDARQFDQAEAAAPGGFLQGRLYEWAAELSRRLERERMERLEGKARLLVRDGKPAAAFPLFEQMLELDPLREDIHEELIRHYLFLGRTHDAARQYRELEERLARELGTAPARPFASYVGFAHF